MGFGFQGLGFSVRVLGRREGSARIRGSTALGQHLAMALPDAVYRKLAGAGRLTR